MPIQITTSNIARTTDATLRGLSRGKSFAKTAGILLRLFVNLAEEPFTLLMLIPVSILIFVSSLMGTGWQLDSDEERKAYYQQRQLTASNSQRSLMRKTDAFFRGNDRYSTYFDMMCLVDSSAETNPAIIFAGTIILALAAWASFHRRLQNTTDYQTLESNHGIEAKRIIDAVLRGTSRGVDVKKTLALAAKLLPSLRQLTNWGLVLGILTATSTSYIGTKWWTSSNEKLKRYLEEASSCKKSQTVRIIDAGLRGIARGMTVNGIAQLLGANESLAAGVAVCGFFAGSFSSYQRSSKRIAYAEIINQPPAVLPL